MKTPTTTEQSDDNGPDGLIKQFSVCKRVQVSWVHGYEIHDKTYQ